MCRWLFWLPSGSLDFLLLLVLFFRPNDMMLKWTTNVHDINNTKCALFMYPQDNYVVAPVTCCTSPGETGRSKPCVFIGSLLLWRRCRTSGAGTLGDDWSCWGTLRRIFQLWAPDARRSWSAAHLQPVDSSQRSRCSCERLDSQLFSFSSAEGLFASFPLKTIMCPCYQLVFTSWKRYLLIC